MQRHVGGIAIIVAAAACGRGQPASTPGPPAPDPAALREEQARILARFGSLTRAQDLLAAGYIPTHGAASIEGVGVTFTRIIDVPVLLPGAPALPPVLGEPNLVMFAPAAGATDTVAVCPVPVPPARGCPVDLASATRPGTATVTDALWADEPYVLVGWGYTARIDSGPGATLPLGAPPELAIIEPAQWFVHEAGWHNLDGTFSIDRAFKDPPHAQHPHGPPELHVGAPHGRFWDVHLWGDRASGVPVVAMASPTPIDGITVPPGSFVYPADLAD